LAIFYRAKKPKSLVYKKFYYINETKWTSLSRRPIKNLPSNGRGIGNAQLWRAKRLLWKYHTAI